MKPVLLAMSNPRSDDPARALWPDPPGCSGWRLWQMLHDACGASAAEYIGRFDRRNLLTGEWGTDRAAAAGREFLLGGMPDGAAVVVLGLDTAHALGIGRRWCYDYPAPIRRQRVGLTRVSRFWVAPHPSGLSRAYNDETVRAAVGLLLARLMAEGTG